MSRDTSKFLIMGSLFAGTLGFIAILTILIASVIGALILWLLAKTVGKISNANFLNSDVCSLHHLWKINLEMFMDGVL